MLSRRKQTLWLLLFSWCSNLLQICRWWNKQTRGVNCQRWNHPTCFFPRFSLRCESSETGSAPDWTLLSLTSAVISHGCWLSNNDCLSGRLSAAQKPLSCQRWLERTYLLKTTLNTALTRRYRGLWEYEFPVTEGDKGLQRRSMAASNTNMGSKIDWKNHSNMRGWPWSAASPFKDRVNTSLGFSITSFRSSPASAFLSSPENREWGAPSPGPHHSLPMVPKEAEPNTKAAVIAILHSPPLSWKPHFNLKCPLPVSPCPTPCGQGWVRVGHHGIPPVGGAMFLPQRLTGWRNTREEDVED